MVIFIYLLHSFIHCGASPICDISSMLTILLLATAYVVRGKATFSDVSVFLFTGGVGKS